jgi:hypothetical protein
MNNTPIKKLTLKCTVTGELVTYRGWDYISMRIERAGSLELLEKTFRSKKGKRIGSASASTKPVKAKQTKEQSVASFNKPKGESSPAALTTSYEACLVDGKYILSKNGEEYAQIVTKP